MSPAFPGLMRRLRSRSPTHHLPAAPQDAFRAFHRDQDFVRKFLKPLLIGELAPEEPSQDRGKNVSQTQSPPRKEGRVCRDRIPCSKAERAGGATAHHHLGSGRTQNLYGQPWPLLKTWAGFPGARLDRASPRFVQFPQCSTVSFPGSLRPFLVSSKGQPPLPLGLPLLLPLSPRLLR